MESLRTVGVLDKSVQILHALADGPLDLVGLQAVTSLPRATAHRLATALEAHHMVRRDQAGRFCLGFELIRLGTAATANFPLAELATPALTELRDRTGESVTLAGLIAQSVAGSETTFTLVPAGMARRLGVDIGALAPADRHVDGVVDMVLDATSRAAEPLTEARLFGWHAALFPTGFSGLAPVNLAVLAK